VAAKVFTVSADHNSEDNLKKLIDHNQREDNVDRRGFLQCMAWAGTGVVWTI